MNFSDIPDRPYGNVDPSWWNALRDSGINLENLLGIGAGAIVPTDFDFANAAAAADVTGLLFDSSVCKSARAWISIRRKSDSAAAYSEVELWLSYDVLNSTWVLQDVEEHGGPSGVTFTVTALGQVQYSSDTVSGSNYSGASVFSATARA